MAEGRENDKNTGGNSTHGNVNGLDMNELNLGLANEESSLHNMVNAYTQGTILKYKCSGNHLVAVCYDNYPS